MEHQTLILKLSVFANVKANVSTVEDSFSCSNNLFLEIGPKAELKSTEAAYTVDLELFDIFQ